MKNEEILEKMGLTKKESTVYLSLLETGPSTVSRIAQQSGLHRPLIYQVLPLLKEKGLVTETPRGKQIRYAAEHPQRLAQLLETVASQFHAFLPELEQTYTAQGKKPLVKFLQGKKGITAVFDDIVRTLKRGDVYYGYTSLDDPKRDLPYLSSTYRKLRDQKQLERFLITNERVGGTLTKRLERAVKVVPKEYDLFAYNITQIMYADKIVFVDYNTETVLVIENAKIVEFQKKLFKLLYDKL